LLDVATLVQRCRHGDDLAWEALVRQYHGRIHAVAYHYLRDADEARDMTQEIFIRITNNKQQPLLSGEYLMASFPVVWRLKYFHQYL